MRTLSSLFDRMPAMNWNIIVDTLPYKGIVLSLTNQRAARYSWRVKWLKQKYFVFSEKDTLKGGPQWRRPLILNSSTTTSEVSLFISSSSKRYIPFKSESAANFESTSSVLSLRMKLGIFFSMWFLVKIFSTSSYSLVTETGRCSSLFDFLRMYSK